MPEFMPLALSAIHQKHLEMGATLEEIDGWKRPLRYTTLEDETQHVREGVGICDTSPVGKLNVQGAGLVSFLRKIFPRGDVVEILRVQRRLIGRNLDRTELWLARLADDEMLLLTKPGGLSKVKERFTSKPVECVHMVDVSSGLASVTAVGLMARELLGRMTELDARDKAFPNMSCVQVKFAEIYSIVLRRDLGGMFGYELYFEREYGEYIWDTLLHEKDLCVVPFGVETLEFLS
mgnify:CR=1 FL=1